MKYQSIKTELNNWIELFGINYSEVLLIENLSFVSVSDYYVNLAKSELDWFYVLQYWYRLFITI